MSVRISSSVLRVASYNVLAQVYVRSAWFSHSEPAACLKWKNRSKSLLKVVENLEADVLLLQEVDAFEDFWEKELKERGYAGVYKQRTQITGAKKDGSAIFYKTKKFELLEVRSIEFNSLARAKPLRTGSPVGLKRKEGGREDDSEDAAIDSNATSEVTGEKDERYLRDCVGILAALRLKEEPNNPTLLFGSSHLFWDPQYADVKLAQARYLRGEADAFHTQLESSLSSSKDERVRVILGGDFNSTPSSDVYKAMISSSDEDDFTGYKSAYGTGLWKQTLVDNDNYIEEPPFTTCVPDWCDTIDYIFYSGLCPLEVGKLPSREELGKGAPNADQPSDHFPLRVDFSI
eukprot:CAMPEP_0196590506 /NCGR_PEP_ID=MMETSP1081-20130531/66825_1 /TAXON_ID=36882 /ORGANISM="Pyramimonas amylifera, Strain CCMP720" /LENGTH=346 /DNA_ID=CAMNT_0041913635 /DNA_START=106 /DNA_END=1146 /DNA_ORIENTATION=+